MIRFRILDYTKDKNIQNLWNSHEIYKFIKRKSSRIEPVVLIVWIYEVCESVLKGEIGFLIIIRN